MAGPGVIRVVTFDFWQTRLADTPESTAAAHALRLRGVGEALARAGHRYDAAALAAGDARALAVLQAIWALHYVPGGRPPSDVADAAPLR